MSSNKQNMKLYTEEQVKYFFECGRNYQNNGEITFQVAQDEMPTKPIELPSDEEIDNAVTEYTWKLGFSVKSYVGDVYKDGAKYVRDKILNK